MYTAERRDKRDGAREREGKEKVLWTWKAHVNFSVCLWFAESSEYSVENSIALSFVYPILMLCQLYVSIQINFCLQFIALFSYLLLFCFLLLRFSQLIDSIAELYNHCHRLAHRRITLYKGNLGISIPFWQYEPEIFQKWGREVHLRHRDRESKSASHTRFIYYYYLQ